MRKFGLGFFVFFVVLGASLFFHFEAKAEPAFPTGLSAGPLSACQVELGWTQNEPGAYYFVYRRYLNLLQPPTEFRIPPSGSLAGAPVTGDFATSSSDGLKKLLSDTTYYYRIRSCDLTTCSQWRSNFVPVDTPSLPNAPAGPAIANIETEPAGNTQQDIELSWTTSPEPSSFGGFAIYMSTNGEPFVYRGHNELWRKNADGTLDPEGDRGAAAFSWRENNLSLGSTYSFFVRAYDTDMNCLYDPSLPPASNPGSDFNDPANNNQIVYSTDSNQVSVPIRPTNLDGASSGGADPTINLTWEDNSTNEDFFELQKATVSDFSSLIATFTPGANNTSFSDSDVNPNITYYYRVRACSGSAPAACSVFSNSVAVATGLSTPTLDASIIYATTTTEVATVYLAWGGVIGATQHEVERSTSDVFSSYDTIATTSGGGFFYDRNLPLNERYYYRVRATGGGQTSFSAIQPVNLNIEYVLEGVGWAYADDGGIGWIKFNSASEGGSTVSDSNRNYSVQIDREGLMTGVAWADSRGSGDFFGWLSFNKLDLVGCPSAPCEARMNEDGELSGWGRFLGPIIDIQDGTYEGAFEGWVHLRSTSPSAGLISPVFEKIAGLIKNSPFSPFASLLNLAAAQSSSDYGVNFDSGTGTFSGAAWAGDVGGWIAFGPSECEDCTVRVGRINRPPSVENVSIEAPTDLWCAETPFYRVRWVYSDPDEDPQQSADIEFVKASDGSVATSTTVSGNEGGQEFYTLFDPLAVLDTEESYKARVVVSDGFDDSLPAESAATTTPTHYWPLVRFNWNPNPTATSTITTFCSVTADCSFAIEEDDTTVNRSDGSFPFLGKEWIFPNGAPGSSSDDNEFVVFTNLPSDVSLRVWDEEAECTLIQEVAPGGTEAGPLKRRIFRER
jgi:hypothetical protein